ncbi:MAG: ATP-binding protein [Steroidobacteraceae bacterium]
MINDLKAMFAAGAWPVTMQRTIYLWQVQVLLLFMLPLLLWQRQWLPVAALWASAAGGLLIVATTAGLWWRNRILWAIPLLIGAYVALLAVASLLAGHGLDAMTAGCLLLVTLIGLSASVTAGLAGMAIWLLLLAAVPFAWPELPWNELLPVNLLMFCAALMAMAIAGRLRKEWHGSQRHCRLQAAELQQLQARLVEYRSQEVDGRKFMEHNIAQKTAQLQAANRHLQETNLQMEAFNYMVSHDMRASLRIMDGFAKALVGDLGNNVSAVVRQDLDRIQSAIRHMHGMVVELLKLSRSGDMALSRQNVNLSALLHELVQDLRRVEPERTVEVEIADNVSVCAAPVLMREVLQNLLFNAWKFTARRKQARIQFGVIDEADGRVFYLSDNGEGFDMDRAAELFKPFSRLHDAHEFEGTGLGLMTVRRIIERHGGRVWAVGMPNQGAKLCFTLGETAASAVKMAGRRCQV